MFSRDIVIRFHDLSNCLYIDYKLTPFIPDFIPAVGDIDAFIKVNKKITNALFVWFWMVYVWLQMAEICFLKLLLDTINARQKAGQIIINFSIRTHEWWQQLIVGKIIEQILIFWYSIPWLCTLYDTNHNLYLFINLFLKKCFLTETVKTNKKKRAKINYWLID